MASRIKHKRSSVAGRIPLAADLEAGELALNTNDGKVYLKKDAQLILTDVQRNNLCEFLERNVDNCLITNSNVMDYLENKSPYCFGGYFYVKEEKFLSPIYMIAQQAIEKVIKFRKVKNGSNKKTTR